MPIAILTVAKLILLLLLYLFLIRAVRTVAMDLRGTPGRAAPPRPAVAPDRDRSPPRKAAREVVVHAPDAKPRVVALDDQPVTLGRSNRMNVRVDDRYVSDEHAELRPGDGGWTVRDLGSTNGTFLNGAKLTRPTTVGPGDQIRLGKTRVEVRR